MKVYENMYCELVLKNETAVYLEVVKSLFRVPPAWAVDAQCDSSGPQVCLGCRHAEKLPDNLRGRQAYPFSEFSEIQYVSPLRQDNCNILSWWPHVRSFQPRAQDQYMLYQ